MAKKTKNNPEQSTKKMSATQRLEALEGLVVSYQQKFDILAEEIDKLSNLILTLNKKVNAIIEAGGAGEINQDSVSGVLINKAVETLKEKVDDLLQLKALESTDDGVVKNDRYFVVAREVDKDGNVTNPRSQFAVLTLPDDLQKQFIGKKVGDLVKTEGSEDSIEITEVYKLADIEKKMNETPPTDSPKQ